MDQSHEFQIDEVAVSQLPAMVLLAQMGWKPLVGTVANKYRRGRRSAVILEDITRKYLRDRPLEWGGQSTKISEENIDKLIFGLKNLPSETTGKQAEGIWNLLVLPQSVEQSLNGSKRAISARLIDFDNPGNNLYHAVPELEVECNRSRSTRKPDIVLFVNGIPLVVIECKRTDKDVQEGVSQTIRNQKRENIPNLYIYAQILLSLNKNENRYGTTGTPAKLWSQWREGEREEHEQVEEHVQKIILTRLTKEDHQTITTQWKRGADMIASWAENGRQTTNQDRTLAGLCHPERLLYMMRNFILFNGPSKVIARFQQVNAVKKTLTRIKDYKSDRRTGGVIWHTQGSGKSLTMVMLARALIGVTDLKNARIILVTDRVDLDKQIKDTFHNTSMEPQRARTGRELTELLQSQTPVVTTIINKFETAHRENFKDESSDIFVLVDESHRTQFGRYHAKMARVLPNACYLAFTGTPISERERSTMAIFGSLIDTYTMRDAIEDGAVVPLIYEGRMIKPDMNEDVIDTWFARLTIDLTKDEKEDLKQKFKSPSLLSKLDNVVHCRAFDIAAHYRINFRNTGLKGQLVAPDKKTALKYKEALDEIGQVSSEVLISAPDSRKGHEDVDEGDADDTVVAFWGKMIQFHGDEERYNDNIINNFKYDEKPEIIIVVSKLLTGFDAPRNTVLYLTRPFKAPATLLQAIARVNRVLDTADKDADAGKDVGFIIDYEGIRENLEDAVATYEAMAGYREDGVNDILNSSKSAINDVSQKHCDLLDVFKSLRGEPDMEAHENYLRDEQIRGNFYEALQNFSKALNRAFSLTSFYEKVPEKTIERYKRDIKRYTILCTSVKRRFADEKDFLRCEKSIERMLHTHVGATEIVQVVPPIEIFNMSTDTQAELRLKSDRCYADTMAYNMKRELTERMKEKGAFKKLSELLREIIDQFEKRRLSEAQYLSRVLDVRERVMNVANNSVPAELAADPLAGDLYSTLLETPLNKYKGHEKAAIKFAQFISERIESHNAVDVTRSPIRKLILKDLELYMFKELREKNGWDIPPEGVKEIQDEILWTAQNRMQK